MTTAATTQATPRDGDGDGDGDDDDANVFVAWLEKLAELVVATAVDSDESVIAAIKECAGLPCVLGHFLSSVDDAVMRDTLGVVRGLCKAHPQFAAMIPTPTSTRRTTRPTPSLRTLAELAVREAKPLFSSFVTCVVDALDLGQAYEERRNAAMALAPWIMWLSLEDVDVMVRTPLLLERITLNLETCVEEELERDMVSFVLYALVFLTLGGEDATFVLASPQSNALMKVVVRVVRDSTVEANVLGALTFLQCLVRSSSTCARKLALALATNVPGMVELVRDTAAQHPSSPVKMVALGVLGCLLEVLNDAAAQASLSVILECAQSTDVMVVCGAARALCSASMGTRGRELLLTVNHSTAVLWALSWSDYATVRADACVALACVVDPNDAGRRHLVRDDPNALRMFVLNNTLLADVRRMRPRSLRGLRALCTVKRNRDAFASSLSRGTVFLDMLVSVLRVVGGDESDFGDDAEEVRLVCETLLEFCGGFGGGGDHHVATLLRSHQPLHEALAVVVGLVGLVGSDSDSDSDSERWRAAVGKARELQAALTLRLPA